MILKYCGRQEGRLRDGMCVNVPTNWAVGVCGLISADAIEEIMEALDRKQIINYDYDYVFRTQDDSLLRLETGRPGYRAGKTLFRWEEV